MFGMQSEEPKVYTITSAEIRESLEERLKTIARVRVRLQELRAHAAEEDLPSIDKMDREMIDDIERDAYLRDHVTEGKRYEMTRGTLIDFHNSIAPMDPEKLTMATVKQQTAKARERGLLAGLERLTREAAGKAAQEVPLAG